MRPLRIWGKIFDRTLTLFGVAASIIILAIVLLTGYEVIMRYAFNTGQAWALELINNLLLYMTFLGAAWLLKKRGHVAIDLVYNHLNPRTRLIINVIISFIGAIICLVMVWYSAWNTITDLMSNIRESTTMQAPRGVISAIMPVGFFMLFVEFSREFFEYLKGLGAKNHPKSVG